MAAPFATAVGCLATRQCFNRQSKQMTKARRPLAVGTPQVRRDCSIWSAVSPLLFSFSWGSRRWALRNLFHLLSHSNQVCQGEKVNVPRPLGLRRPSETCLLLFVADVHTLFLFGQHSGRMIRGGTKVAKVRQSQGSRTNNCNTSCFNLDGLGPQARCAAPRQAKPVPLLSRVLF